MDSMSMSVRAIVAAIVVLAGAGAEAQQNPKPAPAGPPPVEVAPQVRPERASQPINVRLDLTITDEMTPGQPAKRTVTMIVADGQSGNIRSMGNQVQARLNVDANPQILSNGHVRLSLGIEYNPRTTGESEATQATAPTPPQFHGGSTLTQRITLVLQPDKPLVISQASDPVSDRRISVEVRATILK